MDALLLKWQGMDPGQKALFVWGLGFFLGQVTYWLYLFVDYYKRYVSFIKGAKGKEPKFFAVSDDHVFGYFIGCGLWPLVLLGFAVYGFFTNQGHFKFLSYLNPSFLLKRFLNKRYKAVILTSPNEHVRGLVEKKRSS